MGDTTLKQKSIREIYPPLCIIVTAKQEFKKFIKRLATPMVNNHMPHAIVGYPRHWYLVRMLNDDDPMDLACETPDLPVVEVFDGEEYKCIS